MLHRRLAAVVFLFIGCAQESRALQRTALSLRAHDEFVVDLSANGEALVARTLPVPEQSDADRRLLLRWLTATGAQHWRFEHTPVLEARYVPRARAVLVLTTEHTLVRLDAPDATPVVLDHDAYGPLSLDARGHAVAYTRGDPPSLEVVRADIATGRTVALAPELVPAWCPALSLDGRELVVVASPHGTPAFWRIREGAAPTRWKLSANTALPTGPGAPVLFGDAMVYESDGALHTMGFDGVARRTIRGAAMPVHVPGTTTLLVHDAQHGVATLTVRDLEVPR